MPVRARSTIGDIEDLRKKTYNIQLKYPLTVELDTPFAMLSVTLAKAQLKAQSCSLTWPRSARLAK